MKEFSNEAYYLLFSALSNRTRLAIIDFLESGPKNVSEISAALKQNQSLILENLEKLEKCMLVLSEKAVKDKKYLLNNEIIEPLSHVLEIHTSKYCPGLTKCIPKEKLKEYMKKEASKKIFIEHQ